MAKNPSNATIAFLGMIIAPIAFLFFLLPEKLQEAIKKAVIQKGK